jgi:hypothetical protein
MFDKYCSIFSRVLFVVSLILLAIAVIIKIIDFTYGRIGGLPYDPGKLLEFAAIFLIFVITIELRQIRELLKK